MTTIAVTNRKGGVGKTSHALHIAAGLATAGYRVGLIDTDSQGHIAVSLGIPPADALFDVLVNGAPLDDARFPIVDPETYSTPDSPAKGELRVLPSAEKAYRISREFEENTFAFLNLVDHMKRAFNLHYIIIDTSPTLTGLDALTYLATDAFVYVTELEALSLQGLDGAVKQMLAITEDRRKHLNRPTRLLGIIPNKRRSTVAHDVGLEELTTAYGAYVWQPVKLNTLWTEASHEKQVLFRYAPSSEAATEAWAVVQSVVEVLKQWQKS